MSDSMQINPQMSSVPAKRFLSKFWHIIYLNKSAYIQKKITQSPHILNQKHRSKTVEILLVGGGIAFGLCTLSLGWGVGAAALAARHVSVLMEQQSMIRSVLAKREDLKKLAHLGLAVATLESQWLAEGLKSHFMETVALSTLLGGVSDIPSPIIHRDLIAKRVRDSKREKGAIEARPVEDVIAPRGLHTYPPIPIISSA